jgi:multidrug efflux pump subunit AcrA (membrane-fusion protein)
MKPAAKLMFVTLPIFLIGVGVLGYIVSNRTPPPQKPLEERATAVRVIVARSQPVVPRISGFGIVSPARTYELIPQVQGIAEYVNPLLQKGAVLPAGAVLLRLSQIDFNLEIAQARANIRAAEARLAELTVAEENLAAALAIEQEALELVRRDQQRIKNLKASGTVSDASLDAVRVRFLAQRQKVLNVESAIALLPTQRAVQTEQIAVYQAGLDTARLRLARTEITLPFAARVSSSTLEVGQYVRAFQIAAEFDGIEAAEVDAQVSVDDLLRILLLASGPNAQSLAIDPIAMREILRSLGLAARVRLHIGQNFLEWPATVDRISDTIDQKSGTVGVIVRIDTAYRSALPGRRPPLTKGMFVEVILSIPAITGVVVPRSALRDGRIMLADADNRLQLVPVRPGFTQGEIALVAEGLAPGRRVVVSAPSPVIQGMLLAVTPDTALMAEIAKMESEE